MKSCIACGSSSLGEAAALSFSELRRLWFEVCELDIATCLAEPYTDARVVLYRCGTCGLECFPPALCGTARLYDRLGQFDYYYQADRWEFGAALRALSTTPQRVLEVGCGPGRFLGALKQRFPSSEVAGLELNSAAVSEARSRGLDVRNAALSSVALERPGAFDVVYAFQVLEHVPAPGEFLRDAVACLRPRGRLVLTVPNADGFTQRAVNDFGNLPPHHLSRWRKNVFERLAAGYGVTVASVVFETVAPYHREWYRTVAIVNAMAAALGKRWRPIELGTGYRLCGALAARLQRWIPPLLWRYRSPGHTMLVTLEKS